VHRTRQRLTLLLVGLLLLTSCVTPPPMTPQTDVPEPPGRLIDVNGHRMHRYCTGEGGPTVLLEAGLGDFSLYFWLVQEELSATTRVCSYDRAGLGSSEPTAGPRTGKQMATQLEALLQAAGEHGPYVLAGHSMGGLVALLFAGEHLAETAGVVLIDSSHPAQEEQLADSLPGVSNALDQASRARWEEWAARAAAGTLTVSDLWPLSPASLPARVTEQIAALLVRPHPWRAVIAEDDGWQQTLREAKGAGALGNVPLVVIAAGRGLESQMPAEDRQRFGLEFGDLKRFDKIWRGLQRDHLTRSSHSRLVVANNSTHYIYLDEPEVVIKAIQSLLKHD